MRPPKLTHNQIAIQLEDEHRYGPPSPRANTIINNHNNNDIDNPSSTDELFLSESYPPSAQAIHPPFFNLTLDSPIGMGRGQPIIPQHTPSPVYGSVERIWKRISNTLLERPYQLAELVDTLSYPAQQSSLNSLQRALSNYHLQLPSVVRDHFLTHDGQDVFTSHSTRSASSASSLGIVWGLWLMSCEEVEAEWGFWRRFDGGLVPADAFTATDFSSSSYPQQQREQQKQHHPPSFSPITPSSSSLHPNRLNQSMSSCPAGWVHEVYSHPGWLPLLSDRVGNYIGVDLSPPLLQSSSSSSSSTPSSSSSSHSSSHLPRHHQHHHHHQSNQASSSSSSSSIPNPYFHQRGGGQGNARPEPGQVIAFGREIDQKVVLWRGEGSQGWANWLASFADDLEDGKFARLIGRKLKKPSTRNSTPKRRRNSDGEGGRWSNSDDESDDTEDGLGDLGYFNNDTAFVSQDEDGDFHGWKLAPEYRGMSVIEALCARSQQRWAEVGSYSSRHVFPKPELERAGASSSHSNPRSPQANGSFTSEDNHTNPTTPIAFVTPPSPRPTEENLDSSTTTTPSAKTRAAAASSPAESVGGGSPVGLQPIPPNRPQKQQQTTSAPKPRRPRVPPPAPMSLDLPTMDSLMLEVEALPSPVHQPRTSTNHSSSSNNNNNGAESRFNAPQIVNRLSMVGQRISEEMGRRTSSSSSSSATGSHGARHASSTPSTRKSRSPSREDANEKEMIGMVMIINGDKNSTTNNTSNQDSDITSTPPTSTNSNNTPNDNDVVNSTMDNQLHHLPIKIDPNRTLDPDDGRKPSDGLGIMKTVI